MKSSSFVTTVALISAARSQITSSLAAAKPIWLTWMASCPRTSIQRARAAGSIASMTKRTHATCRMEWSSCFAAYSKAAIMSLSSR